MLNHSIQKIRTLSGSDSQQVSQQMYAMCTVYYHVSSSLGNNNHRAMLENQRLKKAINENDAEILASEMIRTQQRHKDKYCRPASHSWTLQYVHTVVS